MENIKLIFLILFFTLQACAVVDAPKVTFWEITDGSGSLLFEENSRTLVTDSHHTEVYEFCSREDKFHCILTRELGAHDGGLHKEPFVAWPRNVPFNELTSWHMKGRSFSRISLGKSRSCTNEKIVGSMLVKRMGGSYPWVFLVTEDGFVRLIGTEMAKQNLTPAYAKLFAVDALRPLSLTYLPDNKCGLKVP